MVILNQKTVLNAVLKLVDLKNQIWFGEITQYTFESLKFPHKQHTF